MGHFILFHKWLFFFLPNPQIKPPHRGTVSIALYSQVTRAQNESEASHSENNSNDVSNTLQPLHSMSTVKLKPLLWTRLCTSTLHSKCFKSAIFFFRHCKYNQHVISGQPWKVNQPARNESITPVKYHKRSVGVYRPCIPEGGKPKFLILYLNGSMWTASPVRRRCILAVFSDSSVLI